MRRLVARARRRDDAGFTLMETVVSLFVVAVVLLGLVYVQSAAALSISEAKQRQQATQLANQVMEQVRALPWVTLSAGLNSDDLTDDESISDGRFRPTYTTDIDEELVTSASQDQPPLYPHVSPSVSMGNATYSIGIYITKTEEWTETRPILWLSVIATRVSGPGAAFRPVALRSQAYSPDGCLSTSVRPYSGPCQAYFSGEAGTMIGQIWLDRDGADAVPELGVQQAYLTMPAVSVSTQAEQTASIDASAITSGLHLKGSGGDVWGGLVKAKVSADDDPSSVLPTDPPAVSVTQSAAASSSTGTFGAVTLTPSTTGTAEAMAGETSGPTVPCKDIVGLQTSAGLPCASAKDGQLSTQSITVNPEPLAGRGLGTFSLATVDPPSGATGPGRAWTARLTQTQHGHCPLLISAGTVGCVSSAASRAMDRLFLGGLPTYNAADSPGWMTGVPFTGMVVMTGYSAIASSELGVGAGMPFVARSGNVRYWNGGGYSTIVLTGTAVNQTLGEASIAYKSGPSTMTITLNGTITADAVSTPAWPLPDCTATACVSASTIPSIVARITYDIDVDGVRTASFAVNANLGTVTATASYKEAPSE